MNGTPRHDASSRVLTLPNLISFLRILLIPAFMWLIVDPYTTKAGLLLFAVVAATDWVDGVLARRLGQVSELGKILDPTADRLAIAAALVALAIRGAFPWWAAALLLARDAVVIGAGAVALARRHARIEVRYLGKVATFTLLLAIGFISWGNLGYALAPAALAIGWLGYAAGTVEYYVTAVRYMGDLRRALAAEA